MNRKISTKWWAHVLTRSRQKKSTSAFSAALPTVYYSFSAFTASYLSSPPPHESSNQSHPLLNLTPGFAPARARPAAAGRFRIRCGVYWRRISGAVRSDLGKGPVLAGSKRVIYEGAAALWMGSGIVGLIRDGLRCRI
jgi:hypothetical protein